MADHDTPGTSKVRRYPCPDEKRICQVSTAYSAITFNHLLLPIWISDYRFRDNAYQVVVNARTGEVQGKRPYNLVKIAAFVVFLILISFIIVAIPISAAVSPWRTQP